jgi:hypothetical protein
VQQSNPLHNFEASGTTIPPMVCLFLVVAPLPFWSHPHTSIFSVRQRFSLLTLGPKAIALMEVGWIHTCEGRDVSVVWYHSVVFTMAVV